MRDVAVSRLRLASVAKKSCRWADSTPQGMVLGMVCSIIIATVGTSMVSEKRPRVKGGSFTPRLNASARPSSLPPRLGSFKTAVTAVYAHSVNTPIRKKGTRQPTNAMI